MKKILYVQHSGAIGGAPRSLAFLIENLDREKYEPIVILVDHGPAEELFKKVGASVIVDKKIQPFHGSTVSGMNLMTFIHNIHWFIPTYFEAKKKIKEINPDILHLNSSCLFMVAKACKKVNPNIKVICHIREPLLKNIFGKILRHMNNKYVDEFISIDQFDAKSTCKKNNVEVIYNFVDFNKFDRNIKSNFIKEKLNLDSSDIVYLYLARLSKSNGALELAKKWNEYYPNNCNKKLVIVGALDNSDKYNDLVNKQKSDNVSILPFFNDSNDVINTIASSNVMICPFVEPHFSRAIIEAAALAKPSIGSNIGGVDELIINNKTGKLYNYKNYDGLKEAIEYYSDLENIEKDGENAYKFALENFDSSKNAIRTIKYYEKDDYIVKK